MGLSHKWYCGEASLTPKFSKNHRINEYLKYLSLPILGKCDENMKNLRLSIFSEFLYIYRKKQRKIASLLKILIMRFLAPEANFYKD